MHERGAEQGEDVFARCLLKALQYREFEMEKKPLNKKKKHADENVADSALSSLLLRSSITITGSSF